MSDLTPVQRIEAAIEWFEQARTLTRGGRWIVDRDVANIVMRPDEKHPNGWDGVMVAQTSDDIEGSLVAELIVTLHRTIDAQLAILREARRVNIQWFAVEYEPAYDSGGPTSKSYVAALALADAILADLGTVQA